MTAFAGSEPEKAGKTAKSSEGAAADKSETDEIEKSRQMQFEARAAAEAEKEQLFLKNPKRCQMSFWFLSEDLLFRMASAAPAQLCQIPHCCRMGYCNRVCADRSSVFGICGVFLLSAGILVCRYEKKQLREMSFFAEKGSVTEIGPAWNGSLPVGVNGRSVWH